MEKFVFFYQELIGGNKHRQEIMAETFREARNIFFEQHPGPHRIEMVINQTTGEMLMLGGKMV